MTQPSREELLACEDEADAAFVENMMRETMSGQIQARRERRELAARVLYECEKRRATNADAVVHEASATASNALAMEPWELCADTFLSDIDALVEAGFLDLHSATQALRTVSDEDWQRALDCAMSCMRPPFHISRSTMDNAMQHAFGMLSLRAVSSTLAALPASSREVREAMIRKILHDNFYTGEPGEHGAIEAATIELSSLKYCPDAVDALRPFAKLAEFITEAHRDSRPAVLGLDNVIMQRLTIGDLRKAKAALKSSSSVAPAEVRTDDLPAIPDDDSDFSPELARKIVAQYQRIVRALKSRPSVAQSSIEYQQQRGAAWDIIDEALVSYDDWMLDDDYEAVIILRKIIGRLRERRDLYRDAPFVAVQPVGKWRLIETAPKDETRILLFQRGRGAFEGWYKIDWPEGAYWMDDADSEPEPTHWQPCLAPPSTVSSTNQPSEGAE